MTESETTEGRPPTPSFAELADWIDGRLTRSDATDMERRVEAAGPRTAATVEWIRRFAAFGRRNPLPGPPPIVRQRLRQAFDRHHGRLGEAVRKTAVLSFDSRDDAVLSGVRGGFDIDEGYRLAFAADSLGVLVDVIPTDDHGGVQLDGQVLSAETESPVWEVTVDHPRGTMSDIGGNADGCFSIAGVPSDAWRLVLSNGVTEIEILRPLGESEV